MQDLVVVVNLNGSACRMMAQKLRAEHFYCRIVSSACAAEDIQRMGARGIVLAAGVSGEAADVPFLMDYLQTGLPMLCVGDSALSLCQTLGGELSEPVPQDGAMQIHLDASDALLDGMEDTDRYQPTARFMSLDGAQATPIATTDGGMLGFHASRRDVWGFSFQLERNDPFSSHLLVSFCQNICGCTAWWTNQALIDRAREEIDRAANGGSALCSLSGGIDSGVCAVLGNLAIGHKLHCIFIDTGLLRKNESEQVMAYYHDNLGLNLRRIDAREEFLTALAGVSDPAEKERIVTERLMSILSREAAAIDDIRLVIQGTNVTDTLYRPHTGSTIDGLPIIEPVRELFKDEIRQVGQELGMPAAWWTNQALIDRAREEIDRAANGGSALCSLSGGIDSGVCAVLGNLAIGHKLHCIFIDTGLLRKNESEQVMAYYHDNLGLNLRRIDAREEFLTALAGVSDPAEKERIVTERLMSILSREAAAIDDIRLVIQGTNVTDTLYRPHTGSTIDGLPIIEPVRELFKDEIRQVGQELGMPAVLVNRQPFPGSGLASRIMADVTAERLDILRGADDIFRHDVEDSNQNKRLWQYFAALALSPFPDGGYVVTLRAVQTAEGAAGNTARFTADLLERVTAHILAQCPKVQRVFYDLTPSKSYKRANL